MFKNITLPNLQLTKNTFEEEEGREDLGQVKGACFEGFGAQP